MRLRLGLLFLVGVVAACGGSVANEPAGGQDSPSGTSSSGGGSEGARGSSGSNGSRGADPGASENGSSASCPPSNAPPNPPECPPTYREACFSGGDAGAPTGPITCWYPGQGDGQGNGCWSDALYQCREADDGDGGKTLRCACAQ